MWIISLVITISEHPMLSSSLSGLDSNEEQDVGHGFKWPIVCWPASWQGNDLMEMHTHAHTAISDVDRLNWLCHPIMQSGSVGGEMSHRRGGFLLAGKRYIFRTWCHFFISPQDLTRIDFWLSCLVSRWYTELVKWLWELRSSLCPLTLQNLLSCSPLVQIACR